MTVEGPDVRTSLRMVGVPLVTCTTEVWDREVPTPMRSFRIRRMVFKNFLVWFILRPRSVETSVNISLYESLIP